MNTMFHVTGPQSLIDALESELLAKGVENIGKNNRQPSIAFYSKSTGFYKNYALDSISHVGEHYKLPGDWDEIMKLLEEETFPKYVKALNSAPGSYTKGKIYIATGEDKYGNWATETDDKGSVSNSWNKSNWEEVSKAEYDLLESIKVGDYVYLNDSVSTSINSKGDIGKVAELMEDCCFQGSYKKGARVNEDSHSSWEPIEYLRKATPQEIEAYKSVTIGGYKAEFKEGMVEFGCQRLTKDTLLQLESLSKVTSIKIAGEEITTSIITKIIDRL